MTGYNFSLFSQWSVENYQMQQSYCQSLPSVQSGLEKEITCRLVFLQDALAVFWKHIFPPFWNENDTKSFFWYLLFYPQFQTINNCKTHYKVVSILFLWNYIPEFKNCGENGSNYEYDSYSLPDDVIYPIQWVIDHNNEIYTPIFKCCHDDDRY